MECLFDTVFKLILKFIIAFLFFLKLYSMTVGWSEEYQVVFLDAFVLSVASFFLGMFYVFCFDLGDKVYDYVFNFLEQHF